MRHYLYLKNRYVAPPSGRLDGPVSRLSLNEGSAAALAEQMDNIDENAYVTLLNFAFLKVQICCPLLSTLLFVPIGQQHSVEVRASRLTSRC